MPSKTAGALIFSIAPHKRFWQPMQQGQGQQVESMLTSVIQFAVMLHSKGCHLYAHQCCCRRNAFRNINYIPTLCVHTISFSGKHFHPGEWPPVFLMQ